MRKIMILTSSELFVAFEFRSVSIDLHFCMLSFHWKLWVYRWGIVWSVLSETGWSREDQDSMRNGMCLRDFETSCTSEGHLNKISDQYPQRETFPKRMAYILQKISFFSPASTSINSSSLSLVCNAFLMFIRVSTKTSRKISNKFSVKKIPSLQSYACSSLIHRLQILLNSQLHAIIDGIHAWSVFSSGKPLESVLGYTSIPDPVRVCTFAGHSGKILHWVEHISEFSMYMWLKHVALVRSYTYLWCYPFPSKRIQSSQFFKIVNGHMPTLQPNQSQLTQNYK